MLLNDVFYFFWYKTSKCIVYFTFIALLSLALPHSKCS